MGSAVRTPKSELLSRNSGREIRNIYIDSFENLRIVREEKSTCLQKQNLQSETRRHFVVRSYSESFT